MARKLAEDKAREEYAYSIEISFEKEMKYSLEIKETKLIHQYEAAIARMDKEEKEREAKERKAQEQREKEQAEAARKLKEAEDNLKERERFISIT